MQQLTKSEKALLIALLLEEDEKQEKAQAEAEREKNRVKIYNCKTLRAIIDSINTKLHNKINN